MKKYLIITVLALSPLLLRAQSLKVSERWLMNERIIDLLESYERFSAFEGRSDSYSYLGLFRSPDVEVWCDYVASDKYGSFIPAKDYVSYSKELEDRSVRISNLKKGEYEYTSGRWRVKVEFDKEVEYEDSLGFTFSTVSPMMGGDFHIAMDCVWFDDDEEFRIEKVTGFENPRMSFPKGQFHIVQRRNEIDSRMLYGGEPLEFNEYGFTIVPEGSEFTFDDDDYVLTQNTSPGSGRYDVCSFSLTPKKWRARGHAGYVFNPLSVNTVYGDRLKPLSGAIDLGVDFGRSVSLARSVKLIGYVGLGLSHSFFSMKSSSIEEDLSYTYIGRPYDLSATESFSFDDFTVSLTGALEFNLSKQMTIDVETGVKTYLNLNAADHYSVRFTSPEDHNLLDGYLSPNERPFGADEGQPKFWVLALVVKGGADFAIGSGLFATAHAGMELGLGSDNGILRNVIYRNPSAGKWYDGENGIYPVVYRNNAGTVEDIKVHSFKNSITSIERGLGAVVELGVKYKF